MIGLLLSKKLIRVRVVGRDRNDYVLEAEKQLSNPSVYRDVSDSENILPKLSEASNKMFSSLRRKVFITEKQLKYFTYDYKKVTNFGKLYLLTKINNQLFDLPGRPVISTCGTPTEKWSEKSYIKDSGDFITKINNLDLIPENAILVIAVGLYPSIPHEVGLRALREALNKRDEETIPTEELLKMAEFVLKNNYFEFGNKIKQQISGTAIGTKFAPPYACIFMSDLETKFLESQHLQPLVWLRYIDDIFFIWTHGEESLKKFLDELNVFNQYIKFTYEYSVENIPFLDLKVGLKDRKIATDLHVKPTDRHQYLHFSSAYPNHTKRSVVFSQTLCISRLCSNESDFERNKKKMRS